MNKGVFPWNWDLENYFGDDDKDWMRREQLFYPEDIATLTVVMAWEAEYERTKIAEANAKAEANSKNKNTLNPGMFRHL